MKIQAIITNPMPSFKNTELTSPPVKSASSESSAIAEHLLIREKNDERKIDALNRGFLGVGFALFASALITTLLTGSRKGHSNHELSYNRAATEFKSLINNNDIPTLDTCKSINKKLKDFLKKQVAIINAPKDADELKISNRLLMSGPPGVGKSYFAKIYAKTIGADYTEIKFADYNSRWIGENIENLSAIFNEIISNAEKNPSKKFVVTFNEIESSIPPVDKLAAGSMSGHALSKIEERNTFLTYLDDLQNKCPNVIVVGTTNLSPMDGLDSAIVSRFKKNIVMVDFPEKDCLFEALKANLITTKYGKCLVQNNEMDIKIFADEMHARKCSYRDMAAILDSANENYILDKINDGSKEYSIDYLKSALKSIELTDGEINFSKLERRGS